MIIIDLIDFIIIEQIPLTTNFDVANIMAKVSTITNVGNHSNQTIHFLLGCLLFLGSSVVWTHLELVWERNEPHEFRNSLTGLIVFEPPQVNGQKLRKCLD